MGNMKKMIDWEEGEEAEEGGYGGEGGGGEKFSIIIQLSF